LLSNCLTVQLSAQSAAAVDPAAVVTRAATVYKAAGSLEADFQQTIEDRMIGTFRSRGKLAQQGGDRFAMRFSDPSGEALVMDGTKFWVYTPSTTPGQVIRMAQPTGPGAPNLVAWLLDDPARRYTTRLVRSDSARGGSDVILLTPRDSTLPFREATVTFGRRDGLPRRIEVIERSGNKRTLALSNVRSGRVLPASTFRFTVPAGVKIVDQ